MNVVVCVKQVPDTTEVRIDPVTNTLVREGVRSVANPFDMYALEEGLRLRERFGGKVTALSMGPPQAVAMLKDTLALGVDAAVLLSDRALAGSDTLATSYALSRAVQKIGDYDLIICGKQTVDGDTGQVGPGLAERLGVPFVGYVRRIHGVEGGIAVVERMIEEGYETIEVALPCVISVVKEINTPRLPSLRGLMKAKSATIPVWSAADIGADPGKIGLAGSPTVVVRIFTPPRTPRGEVLEGQPAEQADQLLAKLRSLNLV